MIEGKIHFEAMTGRQRKNVEEIINEGYMDYAFPIEIFCDYIKCKEYGSYKKCYSDKYKRCKKYEDEK